MDRIWLLLARKQRQEPRMSQDPAPRLVSHVDALKLGSEAARQPIERSEIGVDEGLGRGQEGPQASVLVVESVQEELGRLSQRCGSAGREVGLKLGIFSDQVEARQRHGLRMKMQSCRLAPLG